VFNVGADTPHTVNELARLVSEAMGVPPRVVHLPPRNEVRHAFASQAKARRFFEPSAPTSLPDGLARMARWAARVGSRKTRAFGPLDIPFGLPKGW
jgi:UDP-glucose 4-epimerase